MGKFQMSCSGVFDNSHRRVKRVNRLVCSTAVSCESDYAGQRARRSPNVRLCSRQQAKTSARRTWLGKRNLSNARKIFPCDFWRPNRVKLAIDCATTSLLTLGLWYLWFAFRNKAWPSAGYLPWYVFVRPGSRFAFAVCVCLHNLRRRLLRNTFESNRSASAFVMMTPISNYYYDDVEQIKIGILISGGRPNKRTRTRRFANCIRRFFGKFFKLRKRRKR